VQIESFDGQRDDEEIVSVWRQHPLTMAKSMSISALLIFTGSIPFLSWRPSWGFEFWLFFILIAAAYGLMSYYLYLNTIYILTDQRIFAIAHKALLFRSNNEVPLKNIQNVAHLKKGLLQMIFDYGSVEVETAGTKTAMTIKSIEHPYLVQQKILTRERKS
jgi:uncharacterized membrane protein YdbT with pleckstrin-like domain